jgi:hypothetical protein
LIDRNGFAVNNKGHTTVGATDQEGSAVRNAFATPQMSAVGKLGMGSHVLPPL